MRVSARARFIEVSDPLDESKPPAWYELVELGYGERVLRHVAQMPLDGPGSPVGSIMERAACTTRLLGEIRAGYPRFPFSELPADFEQQLRA